MHKSTLFHHLGSTTTFIVLLMAASALAAAPAQKLTEKLGCSHILPQGKSGYYAYLDPQTGKLTSAAAISNPGIRLGVKELYAFSTFHEGLTATRIGEGLTGLDLQGRFQQGSIAVLDAKGRTRIIHIGGEIFLSEAGRCMRAAIIDKYRMGLVGE